MGLFGRKPVHVELEVSSDTFDVVYLCVCGLVAAKALAAFFRRGRLAATLRARVASLVEAGAYAFAYAAIALCFGGCVDGLFGAYDGAARLPSVLLEVCLGAAQESDIPNFKGSDLGRFPLVLADFWTSDHLSERSRSVDAFSGTRARGTLTLKRR